MVSVRLCAKMPTEALVVPELGSIVGGKYRLLRVLGEGGMGAVYEAENTLTLKRAAIKRLHPALLAHEDAYMRVLHEARASARIRHRNVVDVYDVVSEGDSICLVMELLIGEPLSTFITRGGLTFRDFVLLLLPAMRGVAAAHAAGVIHRDVKPENIFLVHEPGSYDITPKVIDFGISKVTDPDAGPHLTRSGITMGTPKYVSYEQLVGAKNVDERADVYAFGVMLYEALTGRAPYDANTFGQQAIMFATTVPRRPRDARPEVPEELDELVWCALARDREERFASMDEFIAALEPFAQPGMYEQELAAFPYVHTEIAPLGVAQLTTTPVHSTPQPEPRSGNERFQSPSLKVPWSESGRGAMSAAPSPIPTPAPTPPASRLPVRRVAALLAFVVVALTIYLLRESAPALPEHGPGNNVAPAAVTEARIAPTPRLEAPVAEPPHELVPTPPVMAAPVEAVPLAPEQMSRSKKPDEARAHHHAKTNLLGAPPAAAAASGGAQDAGAEAQRPSEDAQDTLHRAGRVRRDQF